MELTLKDWEVGQKTPIARAILATSRDSNQAGCSNRADTFVYELGHHASFVGIVIEFLDRSVT